VLAKIVSICKVIQLALSSMIKIDLVMIEVQVGEYTGEDDIVRIQDIYARN
jgi:acetolactate synthase small subunit